MRMVTGCPTQGMAWRSFCGSWFHVYVGGAVIGAAGVAKNGEARDAAMILFRAVVLQESENE
jgi:hypothetical protein